MKQRPPATPVEALQDAGARLVFIIDHVFSEPAAAFQAAEDLERDLRRLLRRFDEEAHR